VQQSAFSRLLFTRREARSILALAGRRPVLPLLDFKASRANLTSEQLGHYRIVHLATHALLNNERPELSGLVLSLVNEKGEPQSGFLRMNETYNLKLQADLVVLSACQTALGREIRGEGLVGITRGFMYAGAPRVVASLWKVDDEATAQLMKHFYERMLKRRMVPSAALRSAQSYMSKQKRWQSPFYWGGFVLQGEYR
jgi:CHAT domain-containing protein